ncbi:hypothetical protein EON63_17990 [archaeon]|nr:MAG: hypothetical protein EON63_17990 [archaeon]
MRKCINTFSVIILIFTYTHTVHIFTYTCYITHSVYIHHSHTHTQILTYTHTHTPVNRGLALKHLRPNMSLSASVVSKEDHGYIMSAGIMGVSFFLPQNEAVRFSKEELSVGKLLLYVYVYKCMCISVCVCVRPALDDVNIYLLLSTS